MVRLVDLEARKIAEDTKEVPRMRRGCRRCRSNGSSNNGKSQNDMHCHVSRAFVFLNCVDVASPWRDVATSMASFK